MADRRVEGRIVFSGTNNGIKGLRAVAVDLDPFFFEDELGSASTDANGAYSISYSHSPINDWFPGRNPDIVVRVYAAGGRLLHATSEQSNVAVTVLTLATIEIHPANIEGWLVTNATLDPAHPRLDAAGNPITWTKGNRIEILKDGDALFPALTDAVSQANDSIHITNMNFWLGKDFITKYPLKNDPTHPFDPLNPTLGAAVVGERLHEVLRARASVINSTNVLVQDVPFIDQIPVISILLHRYIDPDSVDEVKEFFRVSAVAVRSLSILTGLNLPSFMHAKTAIIDGRTAFVIGSVFSRLYYGDTDHLVCDARHGSELVHDISVKVEGPAVEHIDRTFTMLWNAADVSAPALSPAIGQAAIAPPDLGIQVVRTLPGGVFTSSATGSAALRHGETGALEAYQRAIANATRFIYLEDQYFTAPEIFEALLHRMSEVLALEVILVVNILPDASGYPAKQVQVLKQFQAELTKKLGEEQVKKRLGIFTLWSCNETEPKYQIVPIYIHSKAAIVDDVWATIGSANLDGASLNQVELDTIVQGALARLMESEHLYMRILGGLFLALASPLVILTALATKIGLSRSTQHANPQQSKQPTRSTEVNIVICESNPSAANPNPAVVAFREALWHEHLGAPAPTIPASGLVKIWNDRADAKCINLQQDPQLEVPLRQKHPAKILRWAPVADLEKSLKALGIPTGIMTVQKKPDIFDFKTGQWKKQKQ